ncbi:MAG: bifunctional phosphoribosylaminoimidazolecarboxamide formyltransferase/IMP cyclohydrolase [Chloroflexi bacterium]|nr:bifunctional phosphoribosylaminoimidazolecarboxamide formyltransferase/IMP cyclohydrolase [Chloroflexota bacterium]
MPAALLSVFDKTNLISFATELAKLNWTLLASGGTAKALRDANLPVTEVADYTGSPEILGGRVKTLHPAIHGGILARATEDDDTDLARIHAQRIDLVAVNLYPFQQTIAKPNVTLADAIENIDIGGVALIRAAAKNMERVTLVCDPMDYDAVLAEIKSNGQTSAETRRRLAVKGFAHTAEYDSAIRNYLAGSDALTITAYPVQTLRYGENPHQKATLYSYVQGAGPLGGEILQGKELSYNNLLDLDAAWRAVLSFSAPTICIVKHLSPCGIASVPTLQAAFELALASDPVSAFGGVIASNREFDAETANSLGDLFVECIAAPGFTSDAREKLVKRKNCRLVSMPNLAIDPPTEMRSVTRGLLRQDIDQGDPANTEWQVVSQRAPTSTEMESLRFAMAACTHVKSNAIVFASGTATVGIGGGQPNRVDSARIAATRAGEKSKGAVMASDAFFPFPDSVEVAAQAGITAIVAPGGSVRDADAIAVANANNMAMVFTGVRHFRH